MKKSRRHVDAIASNADGSFIIGGSCLSNRYWNGSLFYFNEINSDLDINVDKSTIFVELEAGVTDVSWISETGRLIAACDSGAIEVWELSNEKDSLGCVARTVEHDNIVSAVSVNANSSKFISADHNGCVKVWNVDEFQPVSVYHGHSDTIWCAAFHSSFSDTFASCSQDGNIFIWDLRQAKPANKLEREFLPSLPTCIAWQPGVDHSLAIGTENGLVAMQDCRVGVGVPTVIEMHTRFVHRLAFAPHQTNLLASVSNDCTSAVATFSNAGSRSVCRFSDHKDFVHGVSWNPLSSYLHTCSWDGTVKSHNVRQAAAEDNEASHPLYA